MGDDGLDQLRQLIVRRDRLQGSLQQAQFELERLEQQLRDDGVPDDVIQSAYGPPPKEHRPRLVKAPAPPRQGQPPRMDGSGFWPED